MKLARALRLLPLLLAAPGFAFGPSPSAATTSAAVPSSPAPRRDGRRVAVVLDGRKLTVVADRDASVSALIPELPTLLIDGKKVPLRSSSKKRYLGDSPGTERRFVATLPKLKSRRTLELRDDAPAGSEAMRLSVAFGGDLCLGEGPAGRVVATTRSPKTALAEIYPAPGETLRLSFAPESDDCPATQLPAMKGNRWDSHMSHTPRHDGVFFMAQDGFHHLEGVAACGRFTLHLYDDRVLPLPVLGAAGRLQFPDGSEVALSPDPAGGVLVAPLPKSAKPPIDVVLFLQVAPGFPEFRFDFSFPFVDACPPK